MKRNIAVPSYEPYYGWSWENAPMVRVWDVTRGDAECWTTAKMYRRSDWDAFGGTEMGEDLSLLGFHVCNNGAGMAFSRRPHVRHGRFHVLVTQSGGLDI